MITGRCEKYKRSAKSVYDSSGESEDQGVENSRLLKLPYNVLRDELAAEFLAVVQLPGLEPHGIVHGYVAQDAQGKRDRDPWTASVCALRSTAQFCRRSTEYQKTHCLSSMGHPDEVVKIRTQSS